MSSIDTLIRAYLSTHPPALLSSLSGLCVSAVWNQCFAPASDSVVSLAELLPCASTLRVLLLLLTSALHPSDPTHTSVPHHTHGNSALPFVS